MKQPGEKPMTLGEARLSQHAIGARLRQMFDQVVRDPVPDEFLEILRRADHREASKR
jgi:hypothetical protein